MEIQNKYLHSIHQLTNQYADHLSITSLFNLQVSKTPDAVAFRCGHKSLTYTQLDQRANQLAHHLLSLGIGRESLIGIALPRSLDMVVSLLAVLKSGAAFLPLDTHYPDTRIQHMLDVARTALVITLNEHAPRFDNTLCLDTCVLDQHSSEAPSVDVTCDDLAYVLFTSGSTGQPKGVAAEHTQLLNRLQWMWYTYPFRDDEAACQTTSFNFVDALWECLGPLLQGIPTVILPHDVVQDPKVLIEQLHNHRVTRLWVVPSLLRTLLNTQDLATRLPHLTFWVATGEALSTDLYQQFSEQLPHATLYNLYGTSEVWDATWFDPSVETAEITGNTVPIGRPIANTSAHILDQQLQSVPVGVPGELHIGGVGLAREYLQQPTLTQEKFIDNPFAQGRLYKTGDLAKYLDDGTIEYLGRLDHQVKVRGKRVELLEVEIACAALPDINDVAVVANEDLPGDARLVAYLVPQSIQAPPTIESLREYLQQQLPDFMIPNQFIFLEQLPLTPNGKVDRIKLRNNNQDTQSTNRLITSTTGIEKKLAQILIENLHLNITTTKQNFRDTGMTSLGSIIFRKYIEAEFKQTITNTELFEYSSIYLLAKKLEGTNKNYSFTNVKDRSKRWRERVNNLSPDKNV